MVNFSTPPGLEGLFDLDRKGVDIRPTLLRVLTDQYVRSSAHSPDEQRHYTELAVRLLNETDTATRVAVSARLAPHGFTPRAVVLQLARDLIEVAEPVLLHSPRLTQADCEAVIQACGNAHAAVLARRTTPFAAVAPIIAAAPATAEAVMDVTASAGGAPVSAATEAHELCELFFAAGSPERRLILLNLDYAIWSPGAPPAPMQRSDIWRIETAALRHHTSTVMRELERSLGVSLEQSRRIVDDELGEPIVAAAKAMALPADVLQRIVLFMNPRVGQSVDRVYELSMLYNEISVDAARRLVTIMRAAEPTEREVREPRPSARSIETVRRTPSDLASAVARRPDTALMRRALGGGRG
jgi:hypothetical protein